jgi:hypothetical protein
LSAALSVPEFMLHHQIQDEQIRRHSNAVKPTLSEENEKSWLQFCLSMIDPVSTMSNTPRFIDMFNVIHVDKKWIYMAKIAQKYYFLPSKEEPHCLVKRKRFIAKLCFLLL